jgi:hypothetical protein
MPRTAVWHGTRAAVGAAAPARPLFDVDSARLRAHTANRAFREREMVKPRSIKGPATWAGPGRWRTGAAMTTGGQGRRVGGLPLMQRRGRGRGDGRTSKLFAGHQTASYCFFWDNEQAMPVDCGALPTDGETFASCGETTSNASERRQCWSVKLARRAMCALSARRCGSVPGGRCCPPLPSSVQRLNRRSAAFTVRNSIRPCPPPLSKLTPVQPACR